MEKRVVLALALCLLVLVGWQWLSLRLFPPPVQPGHPRPAGIDAVNVPAAPDRAPPASDQSGQPAALSPGPRPVAEQLAIVEDPGRYRAKTTSRGAGLSSYELLDPKYFTRDTRMLVLRPGATRPEIEKYEVDRSQPGRPNNLINTYKPSLVVRFPQSGFPFPDNPEQQEWKLVAQDDSAQRLEYLWESADASVTKKLSFKHDYRIETEIRLTNKKAVPLNYHLSLGLNGFQDPQQKSSFFRRVPQNQVMWDRAGKMQAQSLDGLQDGPPSADKLLGDLRWIGIGQQYFLLAVAFERGPEVGDKQGRIEVGRTQTGELTGEMAIAAEFSERTLAPGQSAAFRMTAYAGPKTPELLDAVAVGDTPAGLKTSIDYTFEFLALPLLWVLRQSYWLVHSWAFSIVLLTILVKLILLYPSHRSMRSMKAMAELKPEMDALRAKYGDDNQRLNMEVMSLYKKHGVNPLGGCLPLLFQLPIYYALYSMLGTAVELYRVPFLWIHDLTAADPFFVLPLVTGGLMFLQTKLSPAPPDPQQKMMAVMMPIMFTAISIFLPAGLTLYIMTNTLLGMLQQLFINRSSPRKAPAAR